MTTKPAVQEVEGVVEGLVQGVGYRMFALRQARELGLAGWVRNRADGSVAFLAQGPETAVRAFLTALREGPRFAQVESVTVLRSAELPGTGLAGFEVRG